MNLYVLNYFASQLVEEENNNTCLTMYCFGDIFHVSLISKHKIKQCPRLSICFLIILLVVLRYKRLLNQSVYFQFVDEEENWIDLDFEHSDCGNQSGPRRVDIEQLYLD
jgi:hypothetical protein